MNSAATFPQRLLHERIRACFCKAPSQSTLLKLPRSARIYNSGEVDNNLYLIEDGPVKTSVLSPAGKECILAVYTAGEVFGELCLIDRVRLESATAVTKAVVRQVHGNEFIQRLANDELLPEFLYYLVARLAEQQDLIGRLVTESSEHRLAATLLRLARKLPLANSSDLKISLKVPHQDLAAMVGTTRTRIGQFLKKFRDLGLIETTSRAVLVVKEKRLEEYLALNGETMPGCREKKPGLLNTEQTDLVLSGNMKLGRV